jgi:hypothetical protein
MNRLIVPEEYLQSLASEFKEEKPQSSTGSNHYQTGQEAIIKRAIAYLCKQPGGIEGENGSGPTMYAARCVVYGFDLGPDVGFKILWDHFNARCQPPWSEKELWHKCQDAHTKPYEKPRGWLLAESDSKQQSKAKSKGKATESEQAKAEEKPRRLLTKRMSEIEAKQIFWLWDKRIVRGGINLLDGDPGLGKSTALCSVIARTTRGWGMPPEEGLSGEEPANVLMLSAEDDPEATIKPRLEAAGADTTKVIIVEAVQGLEGERPAILPFDLDLMEQMVVEQQIKLITVDPFMAYLDSEIDSHKDQDIRIAMHRLRLLAMKTGVAIVLVRHLNKLVSVQSALYRGGGSIAIIGAARSGLLVGRHPDLKDTLVLAMNKCNLCRPPTSLTYTMETVGHVARIVWGPECDISADELLSSRKDSKACKGVAEQCAEAITDYLKDGPKPSKDLEAYLKQLGYSPNAVQDGRQAAKVKAEKQVFSGIWMVSLEATPQGGG